MAKTKLPKRIGGVKIPKKVRKQAEKAIRLVDTPAVRDLAIAGLTMAAGKLSAKASDARRTVANEEPQLGDLLRQTAIDGARRFLAGFEEGRKDAGGPAPQPARRRPRKPIARAPRPAAAARD